jgi:serine/threonine-protein kinase
VISVGRTRGELVVILRDTEKGFAAEVRRLVAYADAAASTAAVASGSGRIGPYHIEAELGRGSMGIVYRARRDSAKEPVAVKLLNPAIASDPAMSARFVREGRAAALVNDPGVVGVTDFGVLHDGRGFLVMELVEGRTLEEFLEESGALPPEEAVRIVGRVAAALAAAHVRGVVHRDLKPSNVFLSGEGQIKVVDFGAALVEDALRGGSVEASVILGTPAYMAPEQAQALPTDERADIYSLGCILFRMLSGEPPFPGGAILEVLRKHIEQPPPRVTSPRGPLPDLLVECVVRALAKRPEERFRSMGEMRGVLDQVLKQLAGNGRSPRG